MLSITIYSS